MIPITKTVLPELKEYEKYLKRIWKTARVTNDGELLKEFERRLQKYLGVNNIVAVGNGTLALQLAFKALELKGEVITTPFTFPATANAIVWEGLTPVFADIDPETFNLDPKEVEKKITEKTSAILAVYVYGNPCDMEGLAEVAERHKLELIYDAAHAFGVEYKGKSVLDWGDVSTLSFHTTKIFHTIEGGAIATKDRKILGFSKLLRNFGLVFFKDWEDCYLPGINAKMSEFQAAMGLCNLKIVDREIKKRKRLYEFYKKELEGVVSFQKLVSSKHNYIYMPVLFKDSSQRDRVHRALLAFGVRSRKYFYPLVPDLHWFKHFPREDKFEVAADIAKRILCLPFYGDMKMSEAEKIVKIIQKINYEKKDKTKSYNLCGGSERKLGFGSERISRSFGRQRV